jgi:hypothetical protein
MTAKKTKNRRVLKRPTLTEDRRKQWICHEIATGLVIHIGLAAGEAFDRAEAFYKELRERFPVER